MQHFKPVFKGCVVVPLTDDDDDHLQTVEILKVVRPIHYITKRK